MLPIFICTTVILAIVVVVMILKLDRYKNSSEFWSLKWMEEVNTSVQASEDLAALEQGTIEIEENYQQELLDEYDKVESLTKEAAYFAKVANWLEQIRLDHQVYCLPILGEQILETTEDEYHPIYDSVVSGRNYTP